jgi:hypothetical protein
LRPLSTSPQLQPISEQRVQVLAHALDSGAEPSLPDVRVSIERAGYCVDSQREDTLALTGELGPAGVELTSAEREERQQERQKEIVQAADESSEVRRFALEASWTLIGIGVLEIEPWIATAVDFAEPC